MNEILIVPPLTDCTTTVVAPPSVELLDLNDHFVQRLSGPGHLADTANRLDTPTADAAQALRALFALAAAAVMRRGSYDRARLRAIGMALRLAGDTDPAISLSLDDLELTNGTTESGVDVVSAAAKTRLFDPEIALARHRAGDRLVRVVTDTDQQLPAAVALSQALGRNRTVLCGRFAAQHQQALQRLRALAGIRIDSWRPVRRFRAEWVGSSQTVRWVTAPGEATPEISWAGWLDAAETAAVPDTAWETCLGMTLTVARLDSWGAAVGVHGTRADLREVFSRLRQDVPCAVELLVGAPGVDQAALMAAVALLTARVPAQSPFVGAALAGLRPFRLPRSAASHWDGVPVQRRPQPGRDLARWVDFSAPGTLMHEERRHTIQTLLAELAPEVDLYPGRLAASVTTAQRDQNTTPRNRLEWNPYAQVVHADHPDGYGHRPSAFVANLRTGTAFRLHPRLVPVVDAVADGDGQRLDRLPSAARAKLLDQLTRAGALRRHA